MISDRVSLSDKLGRKDWPFIAKDGAVDTLLSAVIDELSPNKHGITASGSEDNLLSWSDELDLAPAVLVLAARIVSLVHGEACSVAFLREPPLRLNCRLPAHAPAEGWRR